MVRVRTLTARVQRASVASVVAPIVTPYSDIIHVDEQMPPIILTCVLIVIWIAVMVATFTISPKSLAFVESQEIEAGGACNGSSQSQFTIRAISPDNDFAQLDQSIEEHEQFIGFMKLDPFINPVHSYPRFLEVMKKAGLPQ